MKYTREQIDAAMLDAAECGPTQAEMLRQLLTENDALKTRLEIDDFHHIDGIEARDATINAQDKLIDTLREDAERWRMSVIIARETLQPPSVRKHQTEINAYINAIAGGFDLTYAIDAARKKY